MFKLDTRVYLNFSAIPNSSLSKSLLWIESHMFKAIPWNISNRGTGRKKFNENTAES